jgi:hypothetical protein
MLFFMDIQPLHLNFEHMVLFIFYLASSLHHSFFYFLHFPCLFFFLSHLFMPMSLSSSFFFSHHISFMLLVLSSIIFLCHEVCIIFSLYHISSLCCHLLLSTLAIFVTHLKLHVKKNVFCWSWSKSNKRTYDLGFENLIDTPMSWFK